jgi:hypothetical protein
MSSAIQRQFCFVVASALLCAILVIVAVIYVLCDGHLIYSLDDPYISLALSQNIWIGHYGINLNESSSPSSSILYPFVLSAFAWSRWQELAPAAINTLAALATAVLFASELCRIGIVTRREDILRGTLLTVMLCVAVNLVGLVFTGLEHSLHLLTSILVLIGVARVVEGEKPPKWLVVAIVLLPLWRFEGMALAAVSILTLAMVGHRRAALVAIICIGATLGIYFFAMSRLGLPLLPSSVLVKSDFANHAISGSLGGGSFLRLMAVHLISSARNIEATPVFILMGVVSSHLLVRRMSDPLEATPRWLPIKREALLSLGVICGALMAHALFASWGWYGRYEAYAVAIGAVGAVLVWRQEIAELIRAGSTKTIVVSAVALACLGFTYLMVTLTTPLASRGIFEQTYQMHRLAVDFYKQPVGVNDIGWVSYRNPNYVLDLTGLGSEAARKARTTPGAGTEWARQLVESRHIGLLMIYDDWFPGQISQNWSLVAVLKSGCWVTASSDTVSIYATSRQSQAQVIGALSAFSDTIPPTVTVTMVRPSDVKPGSADAVDIVSRTCRRALAVLKLL